MRISFDTDPHPDFPLYSRAHTAVVLPGVVPPLTWTILGPLVERAARVMFSRRFGVMRRPRDDRYLFFGRFAGRMYQNVSMLQLVARRGPGDAIGALEAEIGLTDDEASARESRWDDRVWTLLSLPFGGVTMATLRREERRAVQGVRRCLAQGERIRRSAATDDELATWLVEVTDALFQPCLAHTTVRCLSSAAVAQLRRTVARAGASDDLAMRLLTGLPDLEASQPSLALQRMAAEVAGKRELRQLVLTAPTLDAIATAAVPGAAELEMALRRFLERFGHRGVCEFDPMVAVWEEQPDVLLRLLQGAVATGGTADVVATQRAVYQQAMCEVQRFRWSRREPLIVTLRVARRFTVRAERMKSNFVLLVNELRRTLRVLSDRLADRLEPGHVALLSMDELVAAARGGRVPTAELSFRQRELDAAAVSEPPVVLDGTRSVPFAADAVSATVLTGLGVSAGHAEAPAAVMHDPFVEFPPGNILVAPSTDTAWTPLFLAAAAVVTDLGGLMSHSSIVARDLGIPAVVNTRIATRVVQTGDLAAVSGDEGRVTITPAPRS